MGPILIIGTTCEAFANSHLIFLCRFYVFKLCKTVCLSPQSLEKKSVWQKTSYANPVRNQSSGNYFARIKVNSKLIWNTLKTEKLSVARLRLADFVTDQRQPQGRNQEAVGGKLLVSDAREVYEC